MGSDAERATERLAVENPTGRPLTLILEPWADDFALAPGERLVVEAEGPAGYAGPPDGWFLDSWRADDEQGQVLVVWASDCWGARVLRPDGTVLADWTAVPIGRFRHLAGERAEGSRPDF